MVVLALLVSIISLCCSSALLMAFLLANKEVTPSTFTFKPRSTPTTQTTSTADTFTADKDSSVPLDEFTPDFKKPIKVKYKEVNLLAEEEKDEIEE